MGVLTKTTAVMVLIRAGKTAAHFQQSKREEDEMDSVFKDSYMPIAYFEDLGSPEMITVTVEAGDKLNA